MNSHALTIALFVPLILFSLYRRFRRNFGRQPVLRKRMIFRAVVLVIAGGAILGSIAPTAPFIEAAGAGLALGIMLAVAGLRLTHFEATPEGEFYTPNIYIGVALSAVLIGRLLYRFVVLAPALGAAQQTNMSNPYESFQRSPLTLGIFMLLIGYYISYSLGVLLQLHRDQRRSAGHQGS